jgi:CubicO group peptidase (beta-lactamase class C family)
MCQMSVLMRLTGINCAILIRHAQIRTNHRDQELNAPRIFLSVLTILLASPVVSAESPNMSAVDDGLLEARQQIVSGHGGALMLRIVADYFPTEIVEAGDNTWQLPGGHSDVLDDLLVKTGEETMTMAEFLANSRTNALLVMVDGEIIHETYRNGSTDQSLFLSASMAKSFTSSLIGIALSEGLIESVDDPVTQYIPELARTSYEGVTIRNLLQMNSGTLYTEDGVPEGERDLFAEWLNRVVFANEISTLDLAATLEREVEPGSKFNYNTIDTTILGQVLARAAGMSVAQYMTNKLWKPMGAERDARYMLDGPNGVGVAIAGSGINASMRDYARFGQLMLQRGAANGKQIVPAEWVNFATRPDPTRPDMAPGEGNWDIGYHYQWWLPGRPGTFLAWGLMGQFIYVDTVNDVVIVKTSYFAPGDSDYSQMAFGLFNAVSDWAAAR